MKRLALLSVVSLMLVTVFAPVALAQQTGEIDVQSVTLGPGGSVTVTGTIQGPAEGYHYYGDVVVRQRTGGNVYNTLDLSFSGTCEAAGPNAFTVSGFSDKPFHGGQPQCRRPRQFMTHSSPPTLIGEEASRLSTSGSVQRGFWIERAGASAPQPFLLSLFTEVRGIGILRTSPLGGSAKFVVMAFSEVAL